MREADAHPSTTLTVLTGTGRYFSAGADVVGFPARNSSTDAAAVAEERRFWLQQFAANNIDVARSFFTHRKILILALNGPAVGLSAALTAHADFIYAAPGAFLFTPFTSLGLVAEGGSSLMFSRRMGLARANEALMLSKRLSADTLLRAGYVNEVLPAEGFADAVRRKIDAEFGPPSHSGGWLDHESMMEIKALQRAEIQEAFTVANVREAMAGLERFTSGLPQQEFEKIRSGAKRHKL